MRIFIEKTFSNTDHRPDAHGLRYEFRHLVNAGTLRLCDYPAFVTFVDAQGGLTNAVKAIQTGASIR